MYIGDTFGNDLSDENGLFGIINYDGLPDFSELPEKGILLICGISGERGLTAGGRFTVFSAGDFMIVRDRSDAVFSADSESESKIAAVFAYGTLVYALASVYGLHGNEVLRGVDIAGEMFEIRRLLKSNDISAEEKRGDALMALHRIFFKAARAASGKDTARKNTASLIRGYIDTHIDGKFTLDELSAMFFVSKTQIFRMFKDSYGMAPMQYILNKKIEYAKHLLSDTDKKMAEIADELSFTDAKHFSKTFKNYAGMLPRDYKKQIKTKK